MPYQIEAADDSLGEVEKFDREVQIRTILQVLEYRTSSGESTRQACEHLGVDYRAFLRWLNAGVLTDYIKTHRDPEIELLGTRAMQAMPEVLEHMIQLATGLKQQRGANPIAAAHFVRDFVDVLAPKAEAKEAVHQTNQFMPVFYAVPYRDSAPVIEAEYRQVLSDEQGETD
jgi:hypothetical protein